MSKIVNKKAYFEYFIIKEFVAGMQLVGSEIKSLRLNKANIVDCFCYVNNNEVFIKNSYIAKYDEASYLNHDERRDRKLLLHKKEIKDICKLLMDNGTTIVPLEVFTSGGRFKMKIGVAKGKKLWDKKLSIKEKDIKREMRFVEPGN